jgi:hypothetical protein
MRFAVLLALAMAPALASSGAAQGRSAEDTKTIESYRLTMPKLRKALPAMYTPGARSCEVSRHSDPSSLSLAEMTRMLDACSPVATSLEQAGISPREAAIIYAALVTVSRRLAGYGGKVSALPPGVVRDNALMLEQNDPEIRKLTDTGGQS